MAFTQTDDGYVNGFEVVETISTTASVNGSGSWKLSRGATRYLLHVHVSAVGGTPTVTVTIDGVNLVDGVTTTKTIATTTITTTGDTYVEQASFPYEYVRISVSSNTNVTLNARMTGVKST